MLVTLVSVSGREANMTVSKHRLPSAGLYVIEEDGFTSVAESCEEFFPDTDMTVKSQRDEAFDEYAEMLVEAAEYFPIPNKLC